jgi:hypothetical protein
MGKIVHISKGLTGSQIKAKLKSIEGGELINLAAERTEREPYCSGWARCALCYHRWIAIVPLGTTGFECPNCGYNHGHYEGPLTRDCNHWTCDCGCQAFSITQQGIYCNFCGAWQYGYDK